MIIKDVSLETVCGITSAIPENEHMGFAFAGKQILMHMATAAVVGTAAGMAGYYKYINYQGR